jgi:hypothetical protein
MTVIDNLKTLRGLLAPEKHWTKGEFARDIAGDRCDIEEGSCWCLAGGMSYVSDGFIQYSSLRKALCDTLGLGEFGATTDLLAWNDDKNRTHAEVLDLIDKTIERLS